MRAGEEHAMEKTADIRSLLKNLHSVFSSTAIDCANAFFSRPCTLEKPFCVVDTLRAGFDYLLSLNASSDEYKAIVCIGTNRESLSFFLGRTGIREDDASDILGELANTYFGMLYNQDEFHDAFGNFTQGVPFLYSGGNIVLPFVHGIEGHLIIDQRPLYVGVSIRENAPLQKRAFSPVKIERRMDYAWVTIPGYLNLKYFSELEDKQLLDIVQGSRGIVLDFFKVENILSIYIRLIVRLKKHADKIGIPLHIINVSDHCRKILETTNVAVLGGLYASEDEFRNSINPK